MACHPCRRPVPLVIDEDRTRKEFQVSFQPMENSISPHRQMLQKQLDEFWVFVDQR